MYVCPQARSTGLAGALVARVLEHAVGLVEDVHLRVVTSNTAALTLYRRAGFLEYGLDRRALKVGADYHDELLMTCTVLPGAPP
jgi:RimJ/RimL family protein N-acetyltransferase